MNAESFPLSRIYHHRLRINLIMSTIWCLLQLFLLLVEGMDTYKNLDCESTVNIISPNYPKHYPVNAEEKWYISAPFDRRILVTFTDFILAYNGLPREDTLDIEDMVDTRANRYYKGDNRNPPPFLSLANMLQIKFNSQSQESDKGFNLTISCIEKTDDYLIHRLVSGGSSEEGHLEISSPTNASEWRRVCSTNFQNITADVLCRELGYPGVQRISYNGDPCQKGHRCIQAPVCTHPTIRLTDCGTTYSEEECIANSSLQIKCYKPGYKGCSFLHYKNLPDGFSITSTAECVSLCKATFNKTVALVDGLNCICADTGAVSSAIPQNDNQCVAPAAGEHQPDTTVSSWMAVYSTAFGICRTLEKVSNGEWNSTITWFGSTARLQCHHGYAANGSDTIQCVPGTSTYYPVWNGLTPSCMEIPNKIKPLKIWLSICLGLLVVIGCLICFVIKKRIRKRRQSDPGRRESRQEYTFDDGRVSGDQHLAIGSISIRGEINNDNHPHNRLNADSNLNLDHQISSVSPAQLDYQQGIEMLPSSALPLPAPPGKAMSLLFLEQKKSHCENPYKVSPGDISETDLSIGLQDSLTMSVTEHRPYKALVNPSSSVPPNNTSIFSRHLLHAPQFNDITQEMINAKCNKQKTLVDIDKHYLRSQDDALVDNPIYVPSEQDDFPKPNSSEPNENSINCSPYLDDDNMATNPLYVPTRKDNFQTGRSANRYGGGMNSLAGSAYVEDEMTENLLYISRVLDDDMRSGSDCKRQDGNRMSFLHITPSDEALTNINTPKLEGHYYVTPSVATNYNDYQYASCDSKLGDSSSSNLEHYAYGSLGGQVALPSKNSWSSVTHELSQIMAHRPLPHRPTSRKTNTGPPLPPRTSPGVQPNKSKDQCEDDNALRLNYEI